MALPSTIADLRHWWDVFDITEFTFAGANVLTWGDRNGVADLAPATGNQPDYTADFGDGIPAVVFNGIGDDIETGALVADPQPHHVFIRMKLAVTAGAPYVIYGTSDAKKACGLYRLSPTNQYGVSGGTDYTHADLASTETGWITVDIEYNGASTLLREDGVILKSGFNAGANDLGGAFSIGGTGAGNSPLNLRGILIYDRLLDATERQTIYDYLPSGGVSPASSFAESGSGLKLGLGLGI